MQQYNEYIDRRYFQVLLETASAFNPTLKNLPSLALTHSSNNENASIDAHPILPLLTNIYNTDPEFSFNIGQKLILEKHGFLGYAARSSHNLKEALELDARYLPIATSLIRFEIVIGKKNTQLNIQLSPLGQKHQTFLIELLVTCLHTMTLQMCPDLKPEVTLKLEYAEPDHRNLYEKYLPATQIQFNAGENSIIMSNELLNHEIQSTDNTLKVLAREVLEKNLQQFILHSLLTDRVSQLLECQLGSGFNRVHIADSLGMSEKSLERKLKQENSSFRHLRDLVTFKHAKRLLTDSNLSIGDIAIEMGYSDASNFSKSFRRLSINESPAKFRQRNNKKEA
jgi:AraC-like DNA-binding protein